MVSLLIPPSSSVLDFSLTLLLSLMLLMNVTVSYTTVVVDFHAANDEFCTFWRSIGLVHLLVQHSNV